MEFKSDKQTDKAREYQFLECCDHLAYTKHLVYNTNSFYIIFRSTIPNDY